MIYKISAELCGKVLEIGDGVELFGIAFKLERPTGLAFLAGGTSKSTHKAAREKLKAALEKSGCGKDVKGIAAEVGINMASGEVMPACNDYEKQTAFALAVMEICEGAKKTKRKRAGVSVRKVKALTSGDALASFDPVAVRMVTAAAESKMPALLVGETGTGKTSIVREVARRAGKVLYRINLTGQTGTDELVGRFGIAPERGTYWIDGVLTRAMREGNWCVLDEVNMALPEIVSRLHSLLDDDKMLVLTEKDGEIVRPADGFVLFSTMNPHGSNYGGTKDLNAAFLSRFPVVVRVQGCKMVAEVLRAKHGASEAAAVKMAAIVEAFRDAYASGEITTPLGIREAVAMHWLVSKGCSEVEAVRAAFTDRIREDEAKTAAKLVKLAADIEL